MNLRIIGQRVILILALTLALAACSSAGRGGYGGSASNTSAPQAAPMAGGGYYSETTSDMGYMDSAKMAAAPEYATAEYAEGAITPGDVGRKIIHTASFNIETKSYDQANALVREQAVGFGGYVQSSSAGQYSHGGKTYRNASYTLRVPKDAFEAACEAVRTIGTVTRSTTGSDDVSRQYYDNEARLNLKQAEEERLLTMLAKTDAIGDLIMLEERLSNVRAEIEMYQSRLKTIDRLADFATITVDLREVDKERPVGEGFGDRLVRAFRASLDFVAMCARGVALFAAAAIVPLGVMACIAGITVLFIKLFRRKP